MSERVKLPADWLREVVQSAQREVAAWPEWKRPAGMTNRRPATQGGSDG